MKSQDILFVGSFLLVFLLGRGFTRRALALGLAL